jgi:hypothetical protein
MKNKSSDDEMPYGFTQRIHGKDPDKVLELVIADLEGTKFDLRNILRWEEDGGQMIGCGNPSDRLNPAIAHMRTLRN